MERGTQIVYIPDHADGNILHEDCEFGFIWKQHPSTDEPAHFCRYWKKNNLGELRTVANSELTNDRDLKQIKSVPQSKVDRAIKRILDMNK